MARNNSWGFWAGAALIGLGILFLIGQLLRVELMHYLWPFFILAFGAAFFIGMVAGGRALGALAIPGSIITTIGLILFFQNLFNLWSTWAYAWALIISGVGVGLLIFGQHSQVPDLGRAGRVVILVGLVLFFVFGSLFELIAGLSGHGSLGGIFWAILLILVGAYIIFGRGLLGHWIDSGPVGRSSLDFSSQGQGVTTIPGDQISGIRRVHFRGLGDMTILQGEREGLEIEASQAVREHIITEVHGDTLEIRYLQSWLDWLQPRFWNIGTPLRYTLYLQTLDMLDAAGLGNTTIPALQADRFELIHSGTGNVTVRSLNANELVAHQAGLGDIEIDGRVSRQDVRLTGTGSYHAGNLESQTATIELSGVGSARVWARETLDARLSGTGSIEYYGSPRTAQQVSGLGSVRRLGER